MNTLVQFSGGRTSGYMLHLLLQQFDGVLPDSYKVCFENTGKERGETLDFVQEVSDRWHVPIVWLEYADVFDLAEYTAADGSLRQRKNRPPRFREVNHQTASRHGEPFLAAMRYFRQYREAIKGLGPIMPNPKQRFCTANLKVKIVRGYLLSLGWSEWQIFMGIRADEQHRAAKLRDELPDYQTLYTPLISLGVVKQDVLDFWTSQDFDLRLDPQGDEGNCDLCFLKATGKLIKIMRADRTREVWWKDAETEFEGNFNRGKPSFHLLAEMIDRDDPKLDKYIKNPIDKTVDCFCGE